MKLCSQPACQQERGRTIPGREINLHAFDFLEAIMRPGMIEELGYPEPELDQAGPVEIAKDNALFRFRLGGFHSSHLAVKIPPRLAVINYTVDPGPELRVHRIVKFTLPPKMKGEIGIEMRENDIRQQFRGGAIQPKRKLFGTDLLAAGASDVAMSADPRLHLIFFCGGVRVNLVSATIGLFT